jgi:hypothetical protein
MLRPGRGQPAGSTGLPDTGRVKVAKQARLWQWAALVYTVVAAAFFAFMPVTPIRSGDTTHWVAPWALLGPGVFGPLAVPVLLALLPLVIRWRRLLVAWVCTAVLGLLCVLLVASAGLLYVPASLLSAVGAYLAGRAPIEDEAVDDTPWKVPD